MTESEIANGEDRVYTEDLNEAVERASSGEDRVVVTRGGKPTVAVISVRELELLEELEDERDLRALHEAETEDDGTRIPWEDVKADAGP